MAFRTIAARAATGVLLLSTLGAGCRARQGPPGEAPARAAAPVERSAPAPQPSPSLESLPTGRTCRVHLRRDALGLSGVAPLSVRQVSPSARAASLEGTVERVTAEWVVLRAGDRTYWVRADVIVAVEFPDGSPSPPGGAAEPAR